MDPVFAMAESAFLDDGSHLDQKSISADTLGAMRFAGCFLLLLRDLGRCLDEYAAVAHA